MREQVISKTYAKSVMELGEQFKIDVYEELTRLQVAINECGNFESLLFLELFTIEEKKSVLQDVVKKLKLSPIVDHFLVFLLEQRRLGLLPLIYKEVTVMDDDRKGFLKGTIEGREEKMDTGIQKQLIAYLEKETGKKIELNYVKNTKITAGHKVTVGDWQLDASLDNQLDKFKQDVFSLKKSIRT